MALLQAVVIGLTALIIAPGLFFYFDIIPKLVVLLAGAAACALAWRGARPSRAFTVLLVASAVWLVAACALSGNPGLSFFGSTWRRFGAVGQLAVLLLAWLVAQNGERGRAVVARGVAAACALAAAYGIAQYFGWDPLLPKASYHIGEGIWTIVRPPSTLGYVSYFATVALMGGFVSLSMAGARPWLRYGGAVLCFTAMALTGTRAALLGLAVGLAAAAYAAGFRISRRVLFAVALAVVAAAAFYFSPPGWQLRSRVRWFREDPWGGARPLLWRDSFSMAMARPVAGFGPEVFTATFPRYESKDLARAYPDFAHESPHNIFLDAAVSEGLPGMACLMALCAMALAAGYRSRQPWMVAALAGGIVAQQFTVFTIPTALIFYAVLALCTAGPVVQASRLSLAWPARIPAVAIAAALLYFAVRYAAADHTLELANRQLAAGDLMRSAVAYRDYQRYRLPGASADLQWSRSLLAAAQTGDAGHRIQALLMARTACVEATRTAEDPFNAWYTLAEISAAVNDAAHTESSLRQAIAANPTWFKPHWTLAQVLRLQGRASEAEAEAAQAADLDGGKHPEVAQTLAQIRALQR